MSTREYHKFSDDVFIRQKKASPFHNWLKEKDAFLQIKNKWNSHLPCFSAPGYGGGADIMLKIWKLETEKIWNLDREFQNRGYFAVYPNMKSIFPASVLISPHVGRCLNVYLWTVLWAQVYSRSVKWKIDNCCYFYKYIQSCIF